MIARTPPPPAPLFAPSPAPGLVPLDTNVRGADRERLTGQNAVVLQRLRKGPLTCTEALNMGIRRLAARCWDLRQHGFQILGTPLDNHDHLYTLLKEPEGT